MLFLILEFDPRRLSLWRVSAMDATTNKMPPGTRLLLLIGTGIILSTLYYFWQYIQRQMALSKIPTIDNKSSSLSERRARFTKEGRALMRQGYERFFHVGAFRLTTQIGETVFVTGDHMVDVLKKSDAEVDQIAPIEHEMECR